VRDEFSEEVLKKWNIQHATVFEIPVNVSVIEEKILGKLN
jgi:hypothetical protein